jgi:hypothetical protein
MTAENTQGQAANVAGLSAQPDLAAGIGPAPAETETFDREYVQKLRDEAAGHRVKAKRTDALNARLATAQAALTGKLADPTDLPFTDDLLDEDGLVDEAKVHAAVEDLIKRKPHLAARRPTGNVGQGARPEAAEVGLASLLRRGA